MQVHKNSHAKLQLLLYLPMNVTSVIQSMDQGVIQNLKVNYHKSFMRKLVNYDDRTIPEFQKQFNVKDAIFMASLTWLDVKQQTLKGYWQKLYPLIMLEAEDKANSEGFGKKSVVSVLRETDGSAKLSITDEALEEWADVDKDEAVTFTLTDEELDHPRCCISSLHLELVFITKRQELQTSRHQKLF